jgi:hypothetical protein
MTSIVSCAASDLSAYRNQFRWGLVSIRVDQEWNQHGNGEDYSDTNPFSDHGFRRIAIIQIDLPESDYFDSHVTQPPAKTEEQDFNNKRDHLDSSANIWGMAAPGSTPKKIRRLPRHRYLRLVEQSRCVAISISVVERVDVGGHVFTQWKKDNTLTSAARYQDYSRFIQIKGLREESLPHVLTRGGQSPCDCPQGSRREDWMATRRR